MSAKFSIPAPRPSRRFAAAAAALLAVLPGCTRTTKYYKEGTEVSVEKAYPAREGLAEESRLSAAELMAKGYVRFGTIKATREAGKSGKGGLSSEVRRTAAKRGAEFVTLTSEIKEGGIARETCITESYVAPDGYTRYRCQGGRQTSVGSVSLSVVSAQLWARDPELARSRAAEAAAAQAAARDKAAFEKTLIAAVSDPDRLSVLLADPKARSFDKLFFAVLLNKVVGRANKRTVELLVKAGAGPASGDVSGWNTLFDAAEAGNAGAVEALLDAGAKTEDQGSIYCADERKRKYGECPHDVVFAAAASGSLPVIEALAARGVSFDKWMAGYSPVKLAAVLGHDKAIERLAAVSKAQPRSLGDALISVSSQGRVPVGAALVRAGAPADYARSYDSWTPLMEAAYSGRLEMVKFLISKGADPNRRNTMTVALFCCSALEIAEHKSFAEVAAELRRGGAKK
jgi:ankyrin repeat protein